jgi:HEAT repeat protein
MIRYAEMSILAAAISLAFPLASPAAPARTPAPPPVDKAAVDKAKEEEAAKAHDEEVKRVLEVFEIEYKAKEDGIRLAAIDKLNQVKDKKIQDRAARIISGPDPDPLKVQAMKVLGGYPGDKKAAQLVAGTISGNKKKPEMIVAALDALGEIGDRGVAPQVLDLFKEKETSVAKAAILASARIRDKSFVDPLLKMVKEFEEEATVAKAAPPRTGTPNPVEEEKAKRRLELDEICKRALSDITFQSFGTAKEWDSWWKKNRGTFKTEPDAAKK